MTDSSGHDSLADRRVGRYRITSSLGRGGMAEVFRAIDEELDREVAIKRVLPAFAAEHHFLDRFKREAQVVAALEHPNILPIYTIGEHQGLPFLVMPLVRGGTLADRMGGRPLPPRQALAWIADLAAALDAAHAAGVLHRDVKPANVLIGSREQPLLADFGIARLFDATRLTRTGTVVGTPVYMAPEVAAGRPAEAAADAYSLAIMAYEMLAGDPPFDGENALSILHQHATRPVPPITGRIGYLPPGVDRALEVGLAKDPAMRPESCSAFAELLAGRIGEETEPVPTIELPPTAAGSTAAVEGPAVATATGVTAVTGSPAVAAAPSGDAYVTVHAPSGVWRRLGQWGLAGLVGGVVALVGFLVLQPWNRAGSAGEAAEGPPLEAASGLADGGADSTEPPAAPTALSPADEPATPAVEAASREEPEAPPVSVPAPRPAAAAEAPPPPAASAVATPPASRSGPLPPSEGPSIGVRLQALRSFTARSTERDFRLAREAASRLRGRGPEGGPTDALGLYAEGGLAYLDGDDRAAARALRAALADPRFVSFWGPSPLMLLASEAARGELEGWQLALGYGDARSQAGAELDALLRGEPDHPRYRFARALVHRFDGEHGPVIRNASPVYQHLNEREAPEARGYLGMIIADAYLGLGRVDEALGWYRRAISAGGPFRGSVAMRAAEAARGFRRESETFEFLQLACEAEIRPACERLEKGFRRQRPAGR